MYAGGKGWPLEGGTVDVTHERKHQDECDHVEAMEEGRPMQALVRRIELHGDKLSDDQRSRIMQIADRCPVHRTLTREIRIVTSRG